MDVCLFLQMRPMGAKRLLPRVTAAAAFAETRAAPAERRHHQSSDPDTAQPGAAARLAPKLPGRTTGLQEVSGHFRATQEAVLVPHTSQNQTGSHSSEKRPQCGFQLEPGWGSLSKARAAPQGQHHSHVKKGRRFWNMERDTASWGSRQPRRPRHQQPSRKAQGLKLGLGQSRHLRPEIHALLSAMLCITGKWLPRRNYISQHPLHHRAM